MTNQKKEENSSISKKQVEIGINLDKSTQDLNYYINEIKEYIKDEQQNFTKEENIIEV